MNERVINKAHSSYDVAFHETLDLLEWKTLCDHISTFASTEQGKYMCKNLVIPSDYASSCNLLAETLEISDLDASIEGGLNFQGIHYLEHILLRCVKGGISSGEELLKISQTLRTARRLRRQIDNPDLRPRTSSLLDNLATLPELEKLLEFGLEEGGRVADRSSQKLFELRRRLNGLRIERRERLQNLLRRYSSILQDTVIGERYGRPVIALKLGVADQVAGTIHDSSSSGNTVFVEPKIVIPLGNKIAEIVGDIKEEEQRLLGLWSEEVGNNFESLKYLCDVMLRLDLALARGRYGQWLGSVPPSLKREEDAPFVIKEFRHPLLVWHQRNSQGEVVVPISFEISSLLRVVAITGPNTGGKTATLKSVGLAALMARCGLLLPCVEASSVPWFNQILADIGDEQSLQQNLSTFSSHIVRICRIIDSITNHPGPSMVLLDEVGAGTDPSEGTSIAIALLKVLADRARLTVATTHFGELKAIKYNDRRFENASVAFDSETIRPTYHLQWGIPGRSNAIAIANRLGLDSAVIQNAQKLVGEKNIEDVNEIIKGLEEQKKRQQDAAEDAAALLVRTELLHDELLDRWKKQRQESEKFQEHGRQKLELSIREGQAEVRKIIRRLRDEGANGEIARTAGQRLRQIQANQQSAKRLIKNESWLPKKGDRVRLSTLGKAGEVVDVSDDGLQLTVLCGMFRSIVDLSSVESLDGLKPALPDTIVNLKYTTHPQGGSSVRTKSNTLDVRGLRVHEAEAVVEEKLRNTVGPIWVVHGIGTGKLKKGLLQWLKTIPYIEKVVDADQKDGGPGCSVVWLK